MEKMTPIQSKSGFKLNGKTCLAIIKYLGDKETDVVGEPKNKFSDFETVYIFRSEKSFVI